MGDILSEIKIRRDWVKRHKKCRLSQALHLGRKLEEEESRQIDRDQDRADKDIFKMVNTQMAYSMNSNILSGFGRLKLYFYLN